MVHHRGMASEADARRIALALPATTERPSYGTPGFRVKDKLFARMHDLPDTLVVWVPDMAEKEALLASAPETYFETPHYDGYPMVLVRLAGDRARRAAEVLTDSWRARAPRRCSPESSTASTEAGGQAAMAARRRRAARRSMIWSTRP